ncbi:MAG: shikimate dehydrogenase family protein [Gemmatimonadales bacterium]
MIGGSTRVFALLGDPVAHSLSPAMYNAAFLALGLDAVYLALRAAPGDVPGLLRGLAAAGGGGNVTIPHKRLVAGLVTGADPLIGAVNTFWGEAGAVVGTNTDPEGILAGWISLDRPGGDWLVFGTGGSALAAVRAAGSIGVGVAVRSRSPERAAVFEARVESLGVRRADPERIGLAVNATPLGWAGGDPLPAPIAALPAQAAVLDLVYRRGATAWVRAARDAGRRAADGRAVLVGQGGGAFQKWFPTVAPPLEVMRAAVDAGLR